MKRLAIGQHVVEYVAKATNEYGNFGAAVGIGLQELRGDRWELIAGVAYSDFNGPNIVAHIASDGSKRWLTREFLRVMFHYPFMQAGVNRITCMIGSGNAASIKLCKHLGFTHETTLDGAHRDGNLLIFRMWKKDARKWLSLGSANLYAKAA